MHKCKYEAIPSFCEKAPTKKYTEKAEKAKLTSNKLKEKICFTLKMHYFLQ